MDEEAELADNVIGALDSGFRWKRWILIVLVGSLLIFVAIRIHLAAGYLMLFLVPLAVVVTGPPKARRMLGFACLVWGISLVYAIFIQLYSMLGGPTLDGLDQLAPAISIGLALGLVTIGAPLWGLIAISSEFVMALCPGATPAEVRRQLWTLIMGINQPYQVIDKGQRIIAKSGGILNTIGGPGIVVIKPGNAVVFERGGTITKIEGPGTVKTDAFETIKEIIDLRPQWGLVEAEDVQTRDGIPLRLKAGVGYQIEPLANTHRRFRPGGGPIEAINGTINGAHPVRRDSVFRAVYLSGTSGWQAASLGAAELALRDAIGRRTLSEIYGHFSEDMVATPAVIPELEAEALRDARTWALQWGVAINVIDIAVLEAPQEVRHQVLQRWEAATQRGLITARGEAEARVLDAIETVKLGVREQTLEQVEAAIKRGAEILTPQQLERYLELLARLTIQMGRDNATALRFMEALEQLSENPNARIVLVPPGTDLTLTE